MADSFSSILKRSGFIKSFSVHDIKSIEESIEDKPGIYIISREKDETRTPITVNESEALRESVKKDLEKNEWGKKCQQSNSNVEILIGYNDNKPERLSIKKKIEPFCNQDI